MPGKSAFVQLLWYFVNSTIFNSPFFPTSSLKIKLLKLFGAEVGKGIVIKPCVNIKYPWKLKIGNYTWIGEQVWIDNLAQVNIGSNVCISQGAMLLCGSHNYRQVNFDLIVKSINIEDGVWIGAQAVVCPGITCKSHSVLSVSSVANSDLEAYAIYQGNPATKKRDRLSNMPNTFSINSTLLNKPLKVAANQ